jgi:hypothetical protein
MHWLVEHKFKYEQGDGYQKLMENLIRMKIAHSYVKVIPFSDDGLTSEDALEAIREPIFCFGSHTLSRIVKRRNYNPGSFISEKLGMQYLLAAYGDEMLNSDMVIKEIKDLEPQYDEFFIRPAEESKSINGQIMTKWDFNEFKDKILAADPAEFSTVKADTVLIVSKIKKIQQECRFFIANKKIISYSQYKVGDTIKYSPVVDSYIIDYVNKIISMDFQPDVAYCLDIAVSDGATKVLEVNCINCSGLYSIDTQKFIMDIEDLTEMYK